MSAGSSGTSGSGGSAHGGASNGSNGSSGSSGSGGHAAGGVSGNASAGLGGEGDQDASLGGSAGSAGASGAASAGSPNGGAGDTAPGGEGGESAGPACTNGEIESGCDGSTVTHCKNGRIVSESCALCQVMFCPNGDNCCADVGAYVLDAPSAGAGLRPDLLLSFGPDPAYTPSLFALATIGFDAPNQEAVIWFAPTTPNAGYANGFVINAGWSGALIDKPFVAVETANGGCELQIQYVEDVTGMYFQFVTSTPPEHCWGADITNQPITRISLRVRSLDPGPATLGVQALL